MKLKGDYKSNVTYSVGDVVRFTNDTVYILQKPAKSGTPPVDTRYWNQMIELSDEVKLCLDTVGLAKDSIAVANNLTTSSAGKVLDARQGKALKELIDALDVRVTALEPTPESEPTGGEGT